MDRRLLDDIVHFMEHDNLTNRYDQFKHARQLADKIRAWSWQSGHALQVRCFLMDLRGGVELLETAG
ncbi:hypothetical protein EJV47_00945 [Hymenobacter gummosus]|uniref:Uncharacterized protein n=2 Tax=Hymenobacter gummosus TaxID=1776032 RepID=A0A431U8H5_9BACT|nr:hypothetical protein EJV47_00945 [Hymenobacter gummosus]